MYKLDDIIREFLIEDLDEQQVSGKLMRYRQIAVSGLRELAYKANKQYRKVGILDVNDNDTVTLPEDFVKELRIGFCFNGRLVSIGQDNNICSIETRKDDCDCEDEADLGNVTAANSDALAGGEFSYVSHYNKNGQSIGKYYGLGGGYSTVGYYKVFAEEGYIALESYAPEKLVIEYLAKPTTVDGDFQVHPNHVEALKSYMYWRGIRGKRSYDQGEKERARRQWGLDLQAAKKRDNAMTLTELTSVVRSGYGLSPKY